MMGLILDALFPISPPVFYGICAGVLALIAWLLWSRRVRGRQVEALECDVVNLRAERDREGYVASQVERYKADCMALRAANEQADQTIAEQAEELNLLQESGVEDAKRIDERDLQIVKQSQELEAVRDLNVKLQLKVSSFEQTSQALKEADEGREVLTIRPKRTGDLSRIQVVNGDGKALLVSPSGYLHEDNMQGVIGRIKTARLEVGKAVRK